MTRVVAILAHPDDAEILAGGTLYKHRQRGDSVEICSVTYTSDSVRGQEGAAGHRRQDRLYVIEEMRAYCMEVQVFPSR
jgi:N-acetylglucosamine malate deacetylase 1